MKTPAMPSGSGGCRTETNPVWDTLKNAISRKPVPVIIESAQEYLEHFKGTEFCCLALDKSDVEPTYAPDLLKSLCEAFRDLRLAFFRFHTNGQLHAPGLEPQSVQRQVLMVYNARKGSGGSINGFKEILRQLAHQQGLSLMLHQGRGGPVKLVEVATCKSLDHFHGFEAALSEYLARVEGSRFALASIRRALTRPNFSYLIAHMHAAHLGEMLRLASYTPARFSTEFESLVENLRTNRVEMGFVSARKGTIESRLPVLKQDATAMGMNYHELVLVSKNLVAKTNDRVVGCPFLLVTMQDHHRDLRENLSDVAVKHRQDQVIHIYRDGGIEIFAPYHGNVLESFIDLRAAIRAYVGAMFPGELDCVVEVQLVSPNQP